MPSWTLAAGAPQTLAAGAPQISFATSAIAGCSLYVLAMLAYRVFIERRGARAPVSAKGWSRHASDASDVTRAFRAFLASRRADETVSLLRSAGGHADSNRTMEAAYKTGARVDVSSLCSVIALETRGRETLVHVEPGVAQDELTRFCLAAGLVPCVVLEFAGITCGGALAGGGIESSSHAAGSFADTVEEVDVLTGDGELLEGVSRTKHPRLFAALRTSYGSIGLVLRIAVRVERARPFVHVRYVHAASVADACAVMERAANSAAPPEFVDGIALSLTSAVVVLGTAVDAPPRGVRALSLRGARSDKWFFWHLTEIAAAAPAQTAAAAAPPGAPIAAEDVITLDDYLFRYDRGAFWMARPGLAWFFGSAAWAPPSAASPRAGPAWILRVLYAWLGSTRQLYRLLHKFGDETIARLFVVQDFVLPSSTAAAAFAADTTAPLNIWPLWLCPVRASPLADGDAGFGFPAVRGAASAPAALWVNVGVYGVPGGGIAGRTPFEPVELNVGLERAAVSLGGRKMLYAQTFDDKERFWAQFDRAAYERAREEYGGAGTPAGSPFAPIDAKVLLGPARVAALRGLKHVNFFAPAFVVPTLAWFGGLWIELLAPRAVHAACGIRHTGFD